MTMVGESVFLFLSSHPPEKSVDSFYIVAEGFESYLTIYQTENK